MKNKTLERLLKKSHGSVIKLLEKCEEGRVMEIRITKEEGLTADESLDQRVMRYLEKLKVKVTIITENEYFKIKNQFYKPAETCTDPIHDIVSGQIAKQKKMELLHGTGLFRIDETSYVTCKECSKILPILGE